MPPKLSQDHMRQVAEWVATYIAEQRTAFYGGSRPIGSAYKTEFQAFFPSDLLSQVHVMMGRAPIPAFYSQLHALGIRNAPAFSDMAGVTFQDVIVHAESLSRTLLFHELVHAVQYKHLGLEGFAYKYVRGFLTGGSYEEIPLEKQAYELEARFAANPGRHFWVEEDVIRRIRLNQL